MLIPRLERSLQQMSEGKWWEEKEMRMGKISSFFPWTMRDRAICTQRNSQKSPSAPLFPPVCGFGCLKGLEPQSRQARTGVEITQRDWVPTETAYNFQGLLPFPHFLAHLFTPLFPKNNCVGDTWGLRGAKPSPTG